MANETTVDIQGMLMREMLRAVSQCRDPIEEQGGIVLSRDEDFLFVKVKNVHEHTSRAPGLYETDQTELRNLVFSKLKEGWKFYSSFHTHPQFSAVPSSLDLAKLFQGFKYNIIYSHTTSVFSFSVWEGDTMTTAYIPIAKIKKLIKQ